MNRDGRFRVRQSCIPCVLVREPLSSGERDTMNAEIATQQPSFILTAPPSSRTQMRVTKRNGSREPVDVNKIVRAVTRSCDGLADVDPMRVALKTIAGLYDGATTRELDELSIRTAASFHASGVNGSIEHELRTLGRPEGARA